MTERPIHLELTLEEAQHVSGALERYDTVAYADTINEVQKRLNKQIDLEVGLQLQEEMGHVIDISTDFRTLFCRKTDCLWTGGAGFTMRGARESHLAWLIRQSQATVVAKAVES